MQKIGTTAYYENGLKYKIVSYLAESFKLRELLIEKGIHIPKILKLEVKNSEQALATIEWFEGTDFHKLLNNGKLTDIDFFNLGKFLASLNNLDICARDLILDNFLRISETEALLCDFKSLYYSDFPEEYIIRYILNNNHYDMKTRLVFLEGYKIIREFDFDKILKKEAAINFDGYQDLYCNGTLVIQGKRSNKRLSMLKDDFKNKNVLDLGCSMGMFAQYAKKNGAEKVIAFDRGVEKTIHQSIDLPAYISFLEDLDTSFIYGDIESQDFRNSLNKINFNIDIIFFLAILGHLKGNRLEYLKWLKSITKVLYYESNLGGKEEQHFNLLKEIGFSKIEFLGDSGDLDGNPQAIYKMFRCIN